MVNRQDLASVGPKVDVINWKLLGTCNLKCKHCYGPPKEERPLEYETLQCLISKFSILRPNWIVLSGGEPLLVPRIEDLARRIKDKGISLSLSTNTTYFNQFRDLINSSVNSLNIPLDGSTPRIHALSRSNEQSFYTFFEVLEHYLANPKIKPKILKVGTVCSRVNQGDLEKISNKLERFFSIIDYWKLYEVSNYDTQQQLRAPLLYSHEDFINETNGLMESSKFSRKIIISSSDDRNKSYFMVNPRGIVVIPTKVDNLTKELPIGDLTKDSLDVILSKWGKIVDESKYQKNHQYYECHEINGRLRK